MCVTACPVVPAPHVRQQSLGVGNGQQGPRLPGRRGRAGLHVALALRGTGGRLEAVAHHPVALGRSFKAPVRATEDEGDEQPRLCRALLAGASPAAWGPRPGTAADRGGQDWGLRPHELRDCGAACMGPWPPRGAGAPTAAQADRCLPACALGAPLRRRLPLQLPVCSGASLLRQPAPASALPALSTPVPLQSPAPGGFGASTGGFSFGSTPGFGQTSNAFTISKPASQPASLGFGNLGQTTANLFGTPASSPSLFNFGPTPAGAAGALHALSGLRLLGRAAKACITGLLTGPASRPCNAWR